MIKMHLREKEFVKILDKEKIKWQYQPTRFVFNNTSYTPDFFIPDFNLYVEIIGTRQAYHQNKRKIMEFKTIYYWVNFVILSPNGNNYFDNKPNALKRISVMTQSTYVHTISLNQIEEETTTTLRKQGYSIIDLYRLGLKTAMGVDLREKIEEVKNNLK